MFPYFLRSTFGFFQQIFPCMVLLSLPYDRENFPHGKKRSAAVMSAICLFLSFLFAAIMTALFYDPDGRPIMYGEIGEGVVGNVYMGLAAILLILFYWNTVKADFSKKLIVLILTVDYAILEYLLLNSLLYLFRIYLHIFNMSIYSPLVLLLSLGIKLPALPIMGFFMARIVKEYLNQRSGKMVVRSLYVVSLLTILYVLFLSGAATAHESVYTSQTTLLRFHFISDFLFVLISMSIIYWYIFRETDLDMKENEFRHQLEIQQIQYASIRGEIDNAAKMRHDIRHHMRVLGRFLEEGKQEEAIDYLHDVAHTQSLPEMEHFCKNPVLNALLQYYVGGAREKHIRLELHIDVKNCHVDPADMTVVIGNLLENSIHACERVEENRFIRLHMGVVNNVLAMILENSCPAVETTDGLPQNSSEFINGEKICRLPWAGVGLKSVISTIKKYHGSSEFRYADGIFCCRMNMEWETGKQDML